VHGEWKSLSDELSAIIEAAHIFKYPRITLFNYLAIDLASMTITAPFCTSVKRVSKPSMAVMCRKEGGYKFLCNNYVHK
jgi:hypothetical protein